MNIFIDAYNLLKQLHLAPQVSSGQKHIFTVQLNEFARAKGHAIFLVYDGGELARPEYERTGAITIIHSGYKRSADDVIKQTIVGYAAEHTLLVSDDRQLCDYAAMAGFASLATADFYTIIKQDIRRESSMRMKQGVAHKMLGYESSAELDALMHASTHYGYEKNYDDMQLSQGEPERLSKKEKKLKKLVKKL